MEKLWSAYWKSSSQARKQRKYRYNAPLHIRGKFVSSHLSKELKDKHKRRSIALRKGDTVKILRGRFRGESVKVDVVDRKSLKVYLEGIKITKKDGTEVPVAVDPSNLLITSLNLDDKFRMKKREVKKPEEKAKPKEKAMEKKTVKKTGRKEKQIRKEAGKK